MANYWQTLSGKPERISAHVCHRENLKKYGKTTIYHTLEHMCASLSTVCVETHNLKVVGSNPTPATNINPRKYLRFLGFMIPPTEQV